MIGYTLRALAALLCVLLAVPVSAVAVRDEVWVANGPVHSSVTSAGLTVMFLGANTGATVAVDGFPRVNGPVHAVVSDGAGGCYIGGEFTQVAGQPRTNLAHIDAFNRLTAWAPETDGAVYALAVNGNTLYVGGDFTRVSGINRIRLAAINVASGAMDNAWAPDPNGSVYVLLINGSTLYAGGDFTQISGVNRNRLAAIGIDSGVASPWNPNVDASVRALALNANLLYVGGDFTQVGGVFRNRLASLDITSAAAGSWNPNANATVRALLFNNGLVYAGGDFTSIGGVVRNRLAAIDSVGGGVTGWNPNADATVRALAVSTTSLYVGGDFAQVGGITRNRIAKLNITATSGITDPAWDPGADDAAAGGVEALVLSGEMLYAGGEFDALNGLSRLNTILYLGGDFSFVGPVTGSGVGVDAGNAGAADFTFPRVNGPVYAVVADGSGGWYIGGAFSAVGATPRSNLAHIDASRAVTAWSADTNGAVRALALAGGVLYAGGEFTQVGASARNRIAALDAASAAVTGWDPDADGAVMTLLPSGTTVYAGGEFTQIGGAARSRIASLDVSTGNANSWDPGADAAVRILALNGIILYAGGDFTAIDGSSRAYLAALDTTQMTPGAIDTGWNPAPNAAVRTLALNGTILYAGGDFTAIDGGSRAYLAALDITQTTPGAIDTGWNPAPNGAVRVLLLNGTTLYTGGDFTATEGIERNRLASLDTAVTSAITDPQWNPGASNPVAALALDGGVLFAGGEFASLNGLTRRNVAALDLATGAATAWDPDANGAVRVMWLSEDGATLFLGGDFTGIGGQNRNRLASLSTVTGAATLWNPGANGSVRALVPSAGATTFFVGGTFSIAGGQSRNWLAEITRGNGTATAWNAAPAGGTGVYALAVNGNVVYAAGDFTALDGKVRNRIGSFDMSVPQITAWAPQIDDGVVRSLFFDTDRNTLYAGGDFTSVAGGAQVGLVALDPGANTPRVWNPQLDGGVRAIARSLDRTQFYIGGDFTTVGGVARNHIALLDIGTATADGSWVVDADSAVDTLVLVNDTAADDYQVYAGGAFATVDGAARASLAALAALPPELQAPVTTAVPAGGLHNSATAVAIELVCNDGGGSGCAATYYTTDGSVPTTSSRLYRDLIPLTSGFVLKFFSVDNAANVEAVKTETYTVELNAPLTTASPRTRVFSSGSLQIVLSCDDGAGSGCTATYYTLDGTQPSASSTLYIGPITIHATTVLKFFSVDAAGNKEGVKREEYARTESKIGAFAPGDLVAIALSLWLRAKRRRAADAAAR